MSWLGDERHIEQSVAQAKRIAARLDQPVSARSLTPPELLDRHRNRIGLAALVLVVGLLVMAFFALREGGALATFAMIFALVALPTMFVAGRMRMDRHRDYRDPQIRIVAGAEGLAFTNPEGSRLVDWLSVEAKVRYVVQKDRATFIGLTLESPFGRLLLDDDWYRNGRNLAAAIVLGKVRAHEAHARDKEGIAPTG